MSNWNLYFYIDSLALNIGNVNLANFIKIMKQKSDILYVIKQPIQHHKSEGCGLYCIFFVLISYCSMSNNMPQLYKFSNNLVQNDVICERNIYKLLEQIQ